MSRVGLQHHGVGKKMFSTCSHVDSTSERNEYQEYSLGRKGGRCAGVITLPHSCADCLEIWESHPPRNPHGLSRPVLVHVAQRALELQMHANKSYGSLC